MSSPHLVTRLDGMAASVPRPRLGEWDVPALFTEAAREIEALRNYALALEANQSNYMLQLHRECSKVNREAIHGVNP